VANDVTGNPWLLDTQALPLIPSGTPVRIRRLRWVVQAAGVPTDLCLVGSGIFTTKIHLHNHDGAVQYQYDTHFHGGGPEGFPLDGFSLLGISRGVLYVYLAD
jgi:hypothetical protein